jgi:flagellar protein FlgJ
MSAVSMLTGRTSGEAKSSKPLDTLLGKSGGSDFSKLLSNATDVPPALEPAAASPADWNASKLDKPAKDPQKLRDTFNEFVGNVVFGQMLSSMRKTVGKAPYMHGGRAEEVFQNQLDQELSKQLTESSAAQFADPMFDLFQLQRTA